MDVPNKPVANKLLKKLYDATHDEAIQARIASLKAEFENLGISSDMFVEERVKAPISSIRKYTIASDSATQPFARAQEIPNAFTGRMSSFLFFFDAF